MKAQVASSSICVRLIALALNSQLKSASVLSSWNWAWWMRRAMLRSRRCRACSATSRCTNSRCDSPSRSARAKRASSSSAVRGTRKVPKSARICSRRSCFVFVGRRCVLGCVRFARRAMIGLLQQLTIVGQRTRRHRFVEEVGTVPACLLRCLLGQGFEDALGAGLRGKDAFDCTGRVGAEADGTIESGEQVAPCVGGQEREDLAGLSLAAALVAQEAVEEAAGHSTQLGKALAQERQVLGRVVAWTMSLVLAALVRRSWLEWSGGVVVQLAQAIAEQKRWMDLPLLADALE